MEENLPFWEPHEDPGLRDFSGVPIPVGRFFFSFLFFYFNNFFLKFQS